MHSKFLVFLLIVFLFFSFFLSACEFPLIERIGAHDKQNPDFIIILYETKPFTRVTAGSSVYGTTPKKRRKMM